MAEDLGQSRTEDPTPRRREEARQQGQVAYSSDLGGAVILLVAVVGLWLGGERLGGRLLDTLRLDWLSVAVGDFGTLQAHALLATLFGRGLEMLGLLLGLLVVFGVAVAAAQVGFHLTPALLGPKWEKLNPAEGWTRLFSRAALFRGLAAVLKVGLVAALAWWVVRGRGGMVAALGEGGLGYAAAQGWGLVLRLALAVAAALVVLGVGDYLFQRWRLEQSLRMTRQELKEEVKREEGDPHIKGRMRKLQRELAQRRMMAQVPHATVVVTNPTHLAVALRYERGKRGAPRVLAKGRGYVAKRIEMLARRHAVPVVENKPVARALFRGAAVDQEIPSVLYFAVAEVLVYVYGLRAAA